MELQLFLVKHKELGLDWICETPGCGSSLYSVYNGALKCNSCLIEPKMPMQSAILQLHRTQSGDSKANYNEEELND